MPKHQTTIDDILASEVIIRRIFFSVLLLLFVFLSRARDPLGAISVTGAASFYLGESELRGCIEKAEQGDGEASMKVYRHFSLGLHDGRKSKYWLKYSANLNIPKAQYELAYHYLMDGKIMEAEEWA